jgi:hypothetical protein
VWQGICAAVKADSLFLTTWRVSMYGFMAVAHFWIFHRLLRHRTKGSYARTLVGNAGCHGLRIFDELSGQLVVTGLKKNMSDAGIPRLG